MGIFDFLGLFQRDIKPKKLSYAEKERILARRVTTKDMAQFSGMPYHLNHPVHISDEPHSHAFAYIDLTKSNISATKAELEWMNTQIKAGCNLSTNIPSGLCIPVKNIVFTPSKHQGYTRLICTPYTFDGKVANFPLSLVFMTDLDAEKDSTHGTLYYTHDGRVAKAEIYFWRKQKGYFFHYETLDKSFVLSKVELLNTLGGYHTPKIIYQDKYWIALEAAQKKEDADFKWLQVNLPDKCPKSISGFRRMKRANSKNFQLLVEEAASRGQDILR